MRYRRADVAGATYFFTVNLADRKKSLLTDHVDILREVLRKVKATHPFRIDAMVILPDHLHALWTLPPDDSDFPTRWMLIKAGFSRQIVHGERISRSRQSKGERGIWQRRYWEHLIRNEDDFTRHADYIHFNPVKHGHVQVVAEWPFSTFHHFVARGIYPCDWSGGGGSALDAGVPRGGETEEAKDLPR